MNRGWYGVVALCLGTSMTFGQQTPAKPGAVELKTTRDQASYAIGMNIGESIKNDSLDLNIAALVQGLSDAMASAAPVRTLAHQPWCT